jgi:hypothetical protein
MYGPLIILRFVPTEILKRSNGTRILVHYSAQQSIKIQIKETQVRGGDFEMLVELV